MLRQNNGLHRTLNLLTDSWAVLALYALSAGVHRFGELARRIEGASQKVLSETLRDLENGGLVSRTAYAEVPPRVEYRLDALRHIGSRIMDPRLGVGGTIYFRGSLGTEKR